MSANKDAILLRINKEDQVRALLVGNRGVYQVGWWVKRLAIGLCKNI